MQTAGVPCDKCVIASNEFDHFARRQIYPKSTKEESVVTLDAHRLGLLNQDQRTVKPAPVLKARLVDPNECV